MTPIQILEAINRLSSIDKQEVINNLQSNSVEFRISVHKNQRLGTLQFKKGRPRILGPTGGPGTKCPFCGK